MDSFTGRKGLRMSGFQKLGIVAVLLALAVVVAPGLARADADTTPPALTRLNLPAEVRTGPAPVVTVGATIVDASGVATADGAACTPADIDRTAVVLRSQPTGLTFLAPFERVKNDDYRANVVLPRYAPAGTLRVDSVILVDCAGNVVHRDQDELEAAGFPTTLSLFGMGDSEAPTLGGIDVAPTSVDNAKATDVTVTATVHDDLSGVAAADWETACGPWSGITTVSFTSPSGHLRILELEHRHDDVYDATLSLRRFDEVGTWTLVEAHLVDCAGNQRILADPKHLPARSVTVTGVDDRTAPAVVGFSVAPSAVDTRAAGADIVFKARVVDDLTGVSADPAPCNEARSYVTVIPPSGLEESAGLVHTSGDDYAAALSLPRFAEAGTWSVRVSVFDCALNFREVGAAQLAAIGLPSTFRVLPSAYDFGGFMSPLGPTSLAQRNAGSAMAVKFRLGGAQGLSIFDAGFPQVQPIECATRQPTGPAVPLSAVEWRFQELVDGLYHYKWKSSPDWHDVCRRLTLGFDDGSRYSADVHFS
jgi:hypothetical protein